MSYVLDDLVALLDPAVATFGTNLFAGGFVDKADAADTQLALYETPGMIADQVLGENPPAAVRPRVQIVARAADYQAARALSQAAYDLLANRTGETIGATVYVRIEALQEPHAIGRDLSNRHLIAFNLQVTRSP